MKVLFLHGWTSVPGGVKPTYLAGHGHTVINPALPDEDFAAAVKIAQAEFDRHQPDAVVGSSRGGAVAMNIRSGVGPAGLALPRLEALGQRHDGQAGHGDPALRGRRRGADRRQPRAADPQRPAAVGTPAWSGPITAWPTPSPWPQCLPRWSGWGRKADSSQS